MAQPQGAPAPTGPLEFQGEVNPRGIGMKCHGLEDGTKRGLDFAMHDYRAIRPARDFRLSPFQVGDFGLAGRFKDAVSGVPVGLERDIVEMAMGDAAIKGAKSGAKPACWIANPRRRSSLARMKGVAMSMKRSLIASPCGGSKVCRRRCPAALPWPPGRGGNPATAPR